MSILKSLADRIRQRSATTIPANDPPAGQTTVTIEDEAAPAPAAGQPYQIPVREGEYFPWKGHVFQVLLVGPMEFTAKCVGITKARAKAIGVKQ